MTKQDQDKLFRTIKKFIGNDDVIIKPEDRLENLGADDIDVMELCLEMEHEFGVTIPLTEIFQIVKVQDLIDRLEEVTA